MKLYFRVLLFAILLSSANDAPAQIKFVKDTICYDDCELIIDVPEVSKGRRYTHYLSCGPGAFFSYVLPKFSALGIHFYNSSLSLAEEGDFIIWDVKLGNQASSYFAKRNMKFCDSFDDEEPRYIRLDSYNDFSCKIEFNAAESDVELCSRILDSVVFRRKKATNVDRLLPPNSSK